MVDTFLRRENNKRHKQKCHQNSMKQQEIHLQKTEEAALERTAV
jgi:hypothetical protein